MQYFDRLVKDINGQSADKRSISILLPAYTLVPEATFPSQLQQAVTVLSHLLGECKRDPSSIMITGDSAGGGLVMTLLSHILRPHPDVRPITLSSPLRGVFVYSPWVSYSTNYASFSRNVGKDALEHNMLRKWAAMYLGTANGESPIAQTRGGDQYSEPLLAEVYWWKGMHTICDEVFIWVGENEIFVDGIEKFAAKFQEGWNTGGGAQERVKLHVAGQEAHIGPIMDMMLQFSIKKRACRSWYSKSG
jgi:acetyl esterase/lipase